MMHTKDAALEKKLIFKIAIFKSSVIKECSQIERVDINMNKNIKKRMPPLFKTLTSESLSRKEHFLYNLALDPTKDFNQ